MNLSKLLGGAAIVGLLLGSIAPAAHAATGSIAYQYDSLGRVIQAKYTAGTLITTVSYAYDSAGNRITVSVQ